MGEKGRRAGGKSGRYHSVTGMTLGLCNLVCILTLWGCVLEKQNWLLSSSCSLVFPQGVGPASRNSGLHNITFRYDSK